jgi:hypothetical protein
MKAGASTRAPAGAAVRVPGSAHALALACLFAAELALFWSATSRHVSWSFPRWHDQVQYLDEAYSGYDWVRDHGFAAAVGHALGRVSPQGSLHGFLALLVFCAAGPSRTAALSVNLLAFLALQAATFLSVKRLRGGYALAWAAVGLLAAAAGPWSGEVGSATDFRLDWLAACAYGVAIAAAAAGGVFRSASASALLGAAVGVVLLGRFLSVIYFSVAFAAFLAWLLCRPQRRVRCARLMLAAGCALAVSGWALWRARRAIYAYYWVGHITGSERALRDSHLSLLSSMRTVASEVLVNQLGWPALALGLCGAAALLACARMRGPPGGPAGAARADLRGAWGMVLVFLAAPAAVLLLHPEKSSPPFSILLPAAAWVVILAWSHLAGRARPAAAAAILGAVAIAGVSLFAAGQLVNPLPRELEREGRGVNALCDYVYFRAEESGLARPRVAVTWDVDALNADVFRLVGRERHERVLPFAATLPTGLYSTTPELVMERLAQSDFVCLVTRAPVKWPFDRQMQAMLPLTRSWCDGNLRRVGELDTFGFSTVIYERSSLPRPAGGVELAAMIAAAQEGPAYAPARPPAPPLILLPDTLPWTTKGPLDYAVRTAYSPATLRALELPEGVTLDPQTGELRGSFPRAGSFAAALSAENAKGATRRTVSIRVSDSPWDAQVDAPEAARVNVPVSVGFAAFDAEGQLDYIDVTDLTAGASVVRVVAGEGERRNWQGACAVTLREPGRHSVLLRFVRFVPGSRDPYVFMDRLCAIDAAP